ncbi:two-component system sensor histidine kinase NtrB [Desulfosarcina ovata]|uniref:histidine kinase n=1 Tax=Desulfosarcina ovata subsp. ovata TaxID=2752305 RepID=A0A5K8A5R6_9BACT|nr:ATP-binding protein [Desulfosarcina ovata]BBO87738.1 hypothetical protein DSCOOX_09180 [Desulfosarcina ovata subsp. ovata]
MHRTLIEKNFCLGSKESHFKITIAEREMILIGGIIDEIDRLNKIVTKLLHFSRPSPPVFKPEDPMLILEKMLDLTTEKVRANGIEVKYAWSGRPCRTMVDREQIQQVFLNLLLNAVKAMPRGGRLDVEMRRTRGIFEAGLGPSLISGGDFDFQDWFVRVRFRDTGCGIGSEALPKVFDPFFTTDPRGTGLGLSIAHKLIEENKGAVYIESTPVKGTDVIVVLPAAEVS